jgi:phosphate/sulfate permease
MRFILLIVGTFALIVGAIWIGQGTGYFRHPASSFMIDDITWAYIGAGLVVGGLLLIYFARTP